MSFSILPKEIKFEILNYLSIGSRYNASLVWQETMDETRRFIPTNEEVMEMMVGVEDDTYFFETFEDLERAGVVATAGHLNSVKRIFLEGIDVTSLPTNIVNSLLKIARGNVILRGVRGLKFSMLKNIESLGLQLIDTKIPEQVKKNISVSGKEINLTDISGNVSGLFESITCNGLYLVEKLNLEHIDLSEVPEAIVNNLAKTIRGKLRFSRMTGFSTSMLDNIKCEELDIHNMEISSQATGDTIVCGKVSLKNLSGNLSGLFEGLTRDEGNSIESLILDHVDMSNTPVNIVNSLMKIVEGHLELRRVTGFSGKIFDDIKCKDLHLFDMNVPAELPEGINVSGHIFLERITGNVIGLIDRITCNCLRIRYMKLYSDATLSLTNILRSRVRELKFSFDGTLEDFSLLDYYDGKGHCEKIEFDVRWCDNEWRNIINKNLFPWAASRGWTVAWTDGYPRYYAFTRSEISTWRKYMSMAVYPLALGCILYSFFKQNV